MVVNGQYCEVALRVQDAKGQKDKSSIVPELSHKQCFSLVWIAQAKGWRTNLDSLGVDEMGVSLRAGKIGHGRDMVGFSHFL